MTQVAETGEAGPEGSIFLSREQYGHQMMALYLGRGPVALGLEGVSEGEVLEYMLGQAYLLDMRARITQEHRPGIWDGDQLS